ncbi:MAG TPA: hypothetical protein VI248_13155 [Kineosporiaceae bacterium]
MERRRWAWIIALTAAGMAPMMAARADDPNGWQVADHSHVLLPGAPEPADAPAPAPAPAPGTVGPAPRTLVAAPRPPVAAPRTTAPAPRTAVAAHRTTPVAPRTTTAVPATTTASPHPSDLPPPAGTGPDVVIPPAARTDGDIDLDLTSVVAAGPPGWAAAAAGTETPGWTRTATALGAARAGHAGTTYLRLRVPGPAVAPATFQQAWLRFRDVLHQAFPQARLVLGVEAGQDTPAAVAPYWPGDDAVDVVGVRARVTAADAGVVESLTDPRGLAAWLGFATGHGRPVGVPEWGIDSGADTADGVTFVRWMQAALAANAATPDAPLAGRVVYAASPPA